MEINDGLMAY